MNLYYCAVFGIVIFVNFLNKLDTLAFLILKGKFLFYEMFLAMYQHAVLDRPISDICETN